MKRILLGLTVALILAPVSQAAEQDPDLLQERHNFKTTLKQSVSHDYLLHLPAGYEETRKSWPLILFLHGAGERGDDLNRVAFHGPPKLVTRIPRARKGETEKQKADKREAIRLLKENFVIVSPQCPKDDLWHPENVSALLDHIEKTRRIDRKRIYLTGLSMGGYGTWALGLRQPGRFAALAPICGGLNSITPLLNRRHKQHGPAQSRLPIWIFQGGKDTGVIPNEAHRAKALMERLGNKHVKLTLFPNAGHDSWTDAYADPELYRWFLSHALP
jgi:predicted peptidase